MLFLMVKKMVDEMVEKRKEKEKENAVVLIGHGSVLPYNEELLLELQRKIEMMGIFKAVRVAFMQINSPGIEEAIKKLVAEGIIDIVVLPVFLAKGVHTIKDIPSKLEKVYKDIEDGNKSVKIRYGEPIGADERIVEVLLNRIKEVSEKK